MFYSISTLFPSELTSLGNTPLKYLELHYTLYNLCITPVHKYASVCVLGYTSPAKMLFSKSDSTVLHAFQVCYSLYSK